MGAIVGDSSRSARNAGVTGALIGDVRQSSANRKTQQNTEQWKQREANNYAKNRNQYNRDYTACLEGKSDTVKLILINEQSLRAKPCHPLFSTLVGCAQ